MIDTKPTTVDAQVCSHSILDLALKRIHSLVDKLSGKFPSLYNIAYLLPFSSHRGLTWRFFDKSANSVLDVGVFRGAVGRLIRLREKEHHFIVGVDLFRPYLDHCRKEGYYDSLILADARFLPFIKDAFDTVMALEVIEHLPKSSGLTFLEEIDCLAKYQIIVSAPVGFIKPDTLDSEFQKHLSGWVPLEFADLGWKIRGMCGFRVLSKTLSYYLSFVIPISYYSPSYAYAMICVKFKEI